MTWFLEQQATEGRRYASFGGIMRQAVGPFESQDGEAVGRKIKSVGWYREPLPFFPHPLVAA
jgi:hypothetical protein